MEIVFENIAAYLVVFISAVIILVIYINKLNKNTRATKAKIEGSIQFGLHEPVSLHPVINHDLCFGCGSCVKACPENDILGLMDGQAHVIHASRCVGHGACFRACPVEAITLCIGTEQRGVELPHVTPDYETNIEGIYIAGELGGMGLIRNAVEQGKMAVNSLSYKLKSTSNAEYDVIIVGAGPAGIAASLASAKKKLKYLTLEQESLGGTVYNFPRAKIIMTAPMDLPMHGKIKLRETSKSALISLWHEVLTKNGVVIHECEKVESIFKKEDCLFEVKTNKGSYTSKSVILAIGRRGTPRKLNIPGEGKEKVAYRLIEPELITNQSILIVGGGDSAIESALLLMEKNEVAISYRSSSFSRLKPNNLDAIQIAEKNRKVKIYYNSNVKEILDDKVSLVVSGIENNLIIKNDLVYIFAGGLLPTEFLQKIGIRVTKKYGEEILKYEA